MENSISEMELQHIRQRLNNFYENLLLERYNKIYDLYFIYLKNGKTPKCKSINSKESAIGYLYVKMSDPKNQKLFCKEIEYLISLQKQDQ